MAKYKDMHSCEDSEIATNNWTTIDRRMLDHTKKDAPCPGAKEQPKQDGRRCEITFRIAQRTKKDCAHQDPGIHKKLSQTCLWVSQGLLWRHGSAAAWHGDRGTGFSRPGRPGMWAPPQSLADNQKTGEELNQRSPCTVVKVPGPPIAEKRREGKGKGKQERYIYLNAEFRRIARREESI